MGWNNYVNLSPEIVKKLTWLKEPVNYIHKNSSGDILRGVLYEIDESTYTKAAKRLTGEKGELVSGDKVYILPNCRIPLYKLKDYFKSVDCTQTGDITECTKIIGHDKISEKIRFQAVGTVMLLRMEEILWRENLHLAVSNWFTQEQLDESMFRYNALIDTAEDICEIKADRTLISHAMLGMVPGLSSYNFNDKYDSRRFITPTGANIIYNQILRKIPVVSEDSIFEKIGKPIILDEDSYKAIYDYLNSKDDGNQKMGSEILSNCDIEKSLYWVWRLAKENQYKVNDQSRFKNVRLFIRMANWYNLSQMNEEEFIEYMYDKGVLTREYFTELWPLAAKSYTTELTSSIMTITMEPSEKYKEFGGEKVVFTKEESLDKDIPVEPEEDE